MVRFPGRIGQGVTKRGLSSSEPVLMTGALGGGRRRRLRAVVVKAVVVARWPGIALRRGVSTEL